MKLPASQAGGVLAAQEMLTQCEHTLHLAKASAASVLQLLEHQTYKQRREVLKCSGAGSQLMATTCISAGLEEAALGAYFRIEDTED